MRVEEEEEQSIFDPRRVFFFVAKVFLILVGVLLFSFLIFFITRGESKGIVFLLFIVISSLIIFRAYSKNIHMLSRLKPEREPELYGNLEAMATLVSRASKDYEYSREKLEELISELRSKEYHIEGEGATFLKNLKDILEEA